MNDRASIGVPKGSAELEVDGVRLAVAREGHGPPVVCLHAVGHGGRDFEAFCAQMQNRFEIVRIDWPGQGRSADDPNHPASAARYADLLAGVLKRLGIERPILIGNSIGGAAAIIHASRAPVRGLVLCDPGGLVRVDGRTRAFCGAFARFFRAGARDAWWFGSAFALYYALVLPSPAARAQRRRIVASAYQLAPVLSQAWESFAAPEADIGDLAAGLAVPTWFAWAKSDRAIPVGLCMPSIRQMPGATLTFFPGGHAAFLEQPQAFAAAFESFAAGLDPGPVASPGGIASPGPGRAAVLARGGQTQRGHQSAG